MSNATGLYCATCDTTIPESEFQMKCRQCGNPLEVRYDLEKLKTALLNRKPAGLAESALMMWKDILPIDDPALIERVSIGEAQTPLVKSANLCKEIGVADVRFKMEMGPTLSLKDRGTSLCALKALELGYDTLCVASSGNNAASVAAYAAKAGLPAIVFIQKDTAAAKMYKMLIYGARVVRIDGDMRAASRLCNEMLERHRWMQAGGPNPYRITAKRTVAYEIVQQSGGTAPDAVVIPCGGSAGMASAHTGFSEMFEMGLIDAMPRLIGVQLAACDPVTQAFEQSREEITPVEKKPSFSDALMNNNPYWGKQAIRAARETGGFLLSVSDDEVADMIRKLGSSEGLFVEPAGAVTVAGLKKLMAENRLPGLERVVCTLTGHGLNAPDAAFGSQPLPEVVSPDVKTVEAYLKL
jgi:threonine synthase